MRVELDRNVCTGHGRCFMEAPDLFDYSDDHLAGEVIGDGRVPWELREQASKAVRSCPEWAIQVLDD